MEYLTEDQEKVVDKIADNLYQLYEPKPSYISDEEAISMYSYARVARYFWKGFVEGMIRKGSTEEEVVWLLQSKHMRWMFDADDYKVQDFGMSMADEDYVGIARKGLAED